MKIILTGSLGHISQPLTKDLVQKRHSITAISSDPQKQKDIEALGATAAIGSIEDVSFLTAAFTGADAVYCMVPPNNYFDPNLDLIAYYMRIANNYAQAIQQSGLKRVVYLSSVGAHLDKGSGIIIGHHKGEAIMKNVPNVAITFIRPVGFYYNLYGFIPMIKSKGFIAANYGADEKLVWVSPNDIATAVAEELETPLVPNGSIRASNKVRYIASDELTGNDTASILGAAIGKPDLKWILIPGEQWQSGLEAAGMNSQISAGLVEMFAAQYSGLLMEHYYRNKPTLGKVKITDFAKDFAGVYNKG